MPRITASLIAATLAGALLTSCATDDDLSRPNVADTPTATSPDPTPDITDDPTGDDATTEEPAAGATGTVIVVAVDDGEVTGEQRVTLPVGGDVTLKVTADVDDQVHVHGYDIHRDLVAGEETTINFTADIPGVFEVELEQAGTLLTKLEVR